MGTVKGRDGLYNIRFPFPFNKKTDLGYEVRGLLLLEETHC